MYLGKADVNTYDKGAGREFLVSNGRGSYGFSTVIGANTRKEHGLFVVKPDGESRHSILVSKIEETIYDCNKKYQLSTNRYKDLVYPDGYRYLQEYQGNPYPSMLFVIHSILLKKSIFMPHGEDFTVIKYELLAAPDKIRLDLRPVFAHRFSSDVSAKTEKNDFTVSSDDSLSITVSGRNRTSCCAVTSGIWSLKSLWFENIIYEQDDAQNEIDNLWSPGLISNELVEGDKVYVVLSEKQKNLSLKDIIALENEADSKFENILEKANIPALSNAEQDMIASSYHLIDDRTGNISPIFTGYPSVKTKSRDTFISLSGLLLATGREEIALRTLNYWINIASANGWIIPSEADDILKFEDADSGLWFIYAADKYLKHTKDMKKFDNDRYAIIDAVNNVIKKYLESEPRTSVVCDTNMLLKLANDKLNSHWMSGLAGDETVVSRRGYLVEINALFYNALKCAENYAKESGKDKLVSVYSGYAEKCAKSFNDTFWSFDLNGLYDWVDADTFKNDAAIRPNQILAVSLPYTPLSAEKAKAVVRLCWNELYTTYGLRTLAPRHEKFKGRFEGRLDQRIKARFRGMAWTWLLGQFITAYLKCNPNRKDLGWIFIRPFNSHLRQGCLGGVAELFDGIMPYRPHGDVLSATSLGELLRVLHEDLERE